MAIAYMKVLTNLGVKPTVIGRSQKSAQDFEVATGIPVVTGGISSYLEENRPDEGTQVIITTGTETLMPTLVQFEKVPFHSILIEKPGAISIEELLDNQERLKHISNKIFIAYNRRFYKSVNEAQKIIEEDGGLQSMHFEFTEWAHKIEPLEKAPGVKENWFFANSSHVVDLAFYLAGLPVEWKTFSREGEVKWHQKTNFCGAGVTDQGVLFSYIANWESAGRWGIELLTKKRRLYLKPMEKLQCQLKGTITSEEVAIEDTLDTEYKPGLFLQTASFLKREFTKLKSYQEQVEFSESVLAQIV